MANKLIGYFGSSADLIDQLILVDTTMTQYGCSQRFGVDLNNVGTNDATKWAIIAIPVTDGSLKYDFWLVTNASASFATTWHNYVESRNHWSSGWEDWFKVTFDPTQSNTDDMRSLFDMGVSYYYGVRLPYLVSVTVVGADNMPILEGGDNIVNVYAGTWNKNQVKAFIDEVMDTPVPQPYGQGTAVLTLTAPGETLTFTSRDKQTAKTVFIDRDVNIIFD